MPAPSPRTAPRTPRTAPSPPETAKPRAGQPAGVRWGDVAIATALALAAAFAATAMAPGPLRTALAFSLLLFSPGFLLLQAFVVPAARGQALLWQCLASVGISPAVVGMLALCTALVEGGFRPGAIVVLVTLGCLGFGTVALVRRRALARATAQPRPAGPLAAPAGQPVPAGAPMPAGREAARAKSGPTRP